MAKKGGHSEYEKYEEELDGSEAEGNSAADKDYSEDYSEDDYEGGDEDNEAVSYKGKRTPEEKAALREKRKARKAEKAELKKKQIAEEERSKKSILRFFRECVSECKKVVWSPKKDVFNNTVIVLTTIVVAAMFIFGVDTLLGALFGLMYKT